MRLAGYVSRERCMSFLWLTWFLWHTENAHFFFFKEKCTFSQAFVPFKGCFEKVEEWLDDNKHLLGTIGMVILVVQVGVRNCSFLLCCFASVPFILPPVFFLLCVSSHLFVSGCLATSKKKKIKKSVHPVAFVPPSSTVHEACVQRAFWAPTHVKYHLKCWSHCLLHLNPVWENHSHLALCQAGCSYV